MRFIRVIVCLVLLPTAASASQLKIQVVDPQSVAVAGARVELSLAGSRTPAGVQSTSAEGIARFETSGSGPFRVKVFAPGFAPETVNLQSGESSLTVHLHLALTVESVTVTATRTPDVDAAAAANIDSLSGSQLDTTRPVAANDAMRFLAGAVVDTAGRRGGLSSLFVRGGDSRYNKVIIDDVPVNEPGGTFDFGVVPLTAADRLEFVRGAQSALYGSDAMTSVVQVFTRNGTTPVPELRFGADGGNYGTAHGFLTLSGVRGTWDYDLFADEFNSSGQGVNDDYSNSSQGGNIGVQLTPHALFRLRARHANSRTGVQGEWNFNGTPLEPPDTDQWSRQNNLLGSAELVITGPSRWEHRLTGFEYRHHYTDLDVFADPGRVLDYPTHAVTDINRAGFEYQGDYLQRNWARATIGYEFEDENGSVGDLDYGPLTHGLRLNQAVYGQELLELGRLSVAAGARFVHNATFGNKGVPRVGLSWLAWKGGDILSGTRLQFSYATGIKEARFDEAFARGPGIVPNPNLKAEENRAFETGFQQSLFRGKYALTATYYNNQFRNQIDFAILDPATFTGQYENIDKSMAHGAELQLHGRPLSRLSFDMAYNYTSTQILEQPFFYDPLHAPGQPLLRRPKHSGSFLLTYLASRWGASLGTSVVGRRPDSDFQGFGVDHAAGYARVDLGGWYAPASRITLYANVENVLDKHYQEVVGYPALGVNARAGVRFRIGGE